MQWHSGASRPEFQGLSPWSYVTAAVDAFGMEVFLNTAEDQLNQLAVAGSPVAWQNPKTFGESEDGGRTGSLGST